MIPCVVCGADARPVRLPLDRAEIALCTACGHGTTVAAPRTVDARSYGLPHNARAQFEREYLGSRVLSYERGLALAGDDRGRTVLDLGCGYGHFLDFARSRGWTVRGFEPSVGSRRQVLPGLRETVFPTLEEAAGGASFDLVTLWDVLEHLDAPLANLSRAAGLLRPGGQALVRVPDARALAMLGDRRLRRSIGHVYLKLCHPTNPEEHLHHFTPRSLSELADRAGLRTVRVIPAAPDERVAAGWTAADRVVRRGLHRVAARIPYEFTALFRVRDVRVHGS